MGWSERNNIQLLTDNDSSICVAHNFVRASAAAESFEEVYNAFVKVFYDAMQIEQSAIFEVLPKEKKVYRCVNREDLLETANIYDFGEGLIGTVAKSQRSVLISDSKLSNKYKMHEGEFSALCVPIQFQGELFGVVYSFHSSSGFFNDRHLKLYELIAEIAASLLARIRQKIELNHLKITLEKLLEEKKAALNIAVETVSNQFSELKFQRDKREILLREVHHRVNNNLQIISSLVSLYLKETKEPGHQTLKAIQSRIQILSSIHLNLLKSLELNEISLVGFLEDLCASLRYNSTDNYVILKFTTQEIRSHLGFNTLIPMGMLIHELAQLAIQKFWDPKELVELDIHIEFNPESQIFELEIQGKNHGTSKGSHENENVQHTIIQALCEQLEGDLIETDPSECKWKFTFREV